MRKILLGCSCLVLTGISKAQQNIGVGTLTPHASAILDASSTTKGMLIPRMNKVQKNAITAPAKGLLIFQDDVDSTGFHYYDGAAWLWLEVLGTAGWKTTGNAGTDTAIHFIGTTDNMPLRFKQNGQHLGQWDLGKSNYYIGKDAGKNNNTQSTFSIGIGDSALATNTNAAHNTAIGFKTLTKSQNSGFNIAVGSFALYSLTGPSTGGNTAIGVNSLRNARSVQFNTAIGTGSLQEHRDSSSNTAIGYQSLTLDTTGTRNVAVGANAMGRNANGSRNVGVGYLSGFNNSSGSRNVFIGNGVNASQTAVFTYAPLYTGSQNNAIGNLSFFNNISGNKNNALGDSALWNNTSGNNNIAIGSKSFFINTIGSNNTIIGHEADAGLDGLVNATAIGATAQVDTSNAMVLGSINGVNSATANVNVAIGTTKPRSALHVSRGSAGNSSAMPSSRISLFEDNSSNYIQLLSPDINETGILAGNASTLIKSGIVFSADSAVSIRTGGNNSRIFAAKSGLVGVGNTNPQSRLHISNGTPAGALYFPGATEIIESSVFSALQLMNPSTTSASILSGTELTNVRSGINFNADSSIAFNSPGFTSRLSVKNDGDILIPGLLGIGNTSPQSKLHISKGTVSGAVYFSGATGIIESSTTNYIQLMNPSTTSASIFSGTELTNARSGINFNADSSIAFNSPGFTSRLSVKNDGDILIPGLLGIGNTSPQSKLHVSKGTVPGALYFLGSTGIIESSNTNYIQLMNPSTTSASILSGTELTNARSSIFFNADSSIAFNSPGFTSRLSVKNDGDILIPGLLGIGNTSPQSKLHISKGTVPGALYFLGSTGIIESSTTNYIQLMNPSTTSASILSGTELTNARSSIFFNADSSVSFATGGFSTRMTIAKNGNTGINTTIPVAILDANGTFKLGNVGTVNSAIIKNIVTIDVGSVAANNELDIITAVANVNTTGVVSISPAVNLPAGIIIAWARVSSAGNITIRYRNVTGSAIDPPSTSYIIAVVQ